MSQSISLLDAEIVTDVALCEGTSAKSGNDYKYLQITFANGYEQRVFLDRAVLYMVESLTNK